MKRRYRVAHAAAGLGAVLLFAGVVLAVLAAVGYRAAGWWWVVSLIGLVLLSNACSYSLGRDDGRPCERWHWRPSPGEGEGDLASRSPAAGRPGASLTGVVGTPDDPQRDGRVGS